MTRLNKIKIWKQFNKEPLNRAVANIGVILGCVAMKDVVSSNATCEAVSQLVNCHLIILFYIYCYGKNKVAEPKVRNNE